MTMSTPYLSTLAKLHCLLKAGVCAVWGDISATGAAAVALAAPAHRVTLALHEVLSTLVELNGLLETAQRAIRISIRAGAAEVLQSTT